MIVINGDKVLSYTLRTGGEIHIVWEEKIDFVEAVLECSSDIIALLLLNNIQQIPLLRLFYVPYARQDRVCNKGEPFSLKIMANLINSMNIPRVILYDPHSDVCGALINNTTIISQLELLRGFLTTFSSWLLVASDQGAYKKLSSVETHDVACAIKVRKNNDLVIKDIIGDVENRDCLVLDDICDGGRTFIEVAKTLKDKKARRLVLVVTYAIFSNGIADLLKYYDEIYYYTSINWSENYEIKSPNLHRFL